MQSLVPACSNIYKLIFNNDQALLLLVQNYDYLQLHQYVPMPHPNNMAAVLHLGYLVTKSCY